MSVSPRAAATLVLLGSLMAAPPCASITLTVEEIRGRSALLAVDGTTARAVAPASAWQPIIEDVTRQDVTLVEIAAEGDRSIALVNHDPSPAGRVEVVQVLDTRLEAGSAYQLRLQARGRVLAEGEAQAYLEGRASGGEWEELARLVLDVTSEWLEATGQLRGRDGHQQVRVGLRLRGRGSVYVDAIRLTALDSDENLLQDGGFEGGAYWQVEQRLQAPGAEWRASPAVIREPTFRCLGLLPATAYEARARLVSAAGRVLEESPVVQFRTAERDVHPISGLRVSEAVSLARAGLTSPCLATVSDGALLIAGHGGGVYAHAVLPTGGLGEPIQIAPAVTIEGSPAQVVGIRCSVIGDRLVVAYALTLGPGTQNRSVRVASRDLRTGETVEPRSIRSSDPLWATTSAAVAECWGTLWALHTETTQGAEGTLTRMWLRPLDPQTLEALGSDLAVTSTPSALVAEPALASVEGELVLIYAGRQSIPGADDTAPRAPRPLYLQRFDGREFHQPVLITATERASQPHAVRMGERLAVVWREEGDDRLTPGGEAMFQALALAWAGTRGASDPVTLLNDRVYADSPSAAVVQGRVLIVERRWEHIPGLPDDPAADLGLWATWVEP